MATVDSLSPELLIKVFKLVPPDPGRGMKTLDAASLVSRRWRDPAQAQMWRYVIIHPMWPNVARRLVASPACGKFRTERVWLWTSALGGGETLEGVLGKLNGLRRVFISSSGRAYGLEWLRLSSVAELTILELYGKFCDLSVAIHPSVRFQELAFDEHTDLSPTLLSTLFASSSSTSFSLVLEALEAVFPQTLLSTLPLVPNLTSVTLTASLTTPAFAHHSPPSPLSRNSNSSSSSRNSSPTSTPSSAVSIHPSPTSPSTSRRTGGKSVPPRDPDAERDEWGLAGAGRGVYV